MYFWLNNIVAVGMDSHLGANLFGGGRLGAGGLLLATWPKYCPGRWETCCVMKESTESALLCTVQLYHRLVSYKCVFRNL